jgi:serine/threonine protein kinase
MRDTLMVVNEGEVLHLLNLVWLTRFGRLITSTSFLYVEMMRLVRMIQTEEEAKDPWGLFRPLVCFWVACELHCASDLLSVADFVQRCCLLGRMRVGVNSFFSVVHRLLRICGGNLFVATKETLSTAVSPFLFASVIPETTRTVGKGAYGEVRLIKPVSYGETPNNNNEVSDTTNTMLFVVKCFDVTKNGMHSFLREISSLSRFHQRSPYLMTAHAVCINGLDVHGIVFSYFSRGNLATELHRYYRESGMSLQHVRRYGRQLLKALNIIHQAGCIHRDVGSFNILVSDDAQRVVLTDFGALRDCRHRTNADACDDSSVRSWTHPICQMYYRPLEMIDPDSRYLAVCYTSSFDMWSVGMVLLDMILGGETVYLLLQQYEGGPLEASDCNVPRVLKPFIDDSTHPLRQKVADRLGHDLETIEWLFSRMLAIRPSDRDDVTVALENGFWRRDDQRELTVPATAVPSAVPSAMSGRPRRKRVRVSSRRSRKLLSFGNADNEGQNGIK